MARCVTKEDLACACSVLDTLRALLGDSATAKSCERASAYLARVCSGLPDHAAIPLPHAGDEATVMVVRLEPPTTGSGEPATISAGQTILIEAGA